MAVQGRTMLQAQLAFCSLATWWQRLRLWSGQTAENYLLSWLRFALLPKATKKTALFPLAWGEKKVTTSSS
jgi:uncharacterized membrane protein YagU involved in acid resistance